VIPDEVFPKGEEAMEVVYERCCGLDVHRDMVVACLSSIEAGQRRKELRTFRTVTTELLAMRQWLLSEGCSHVGMESTGVLWRPVYDRLAGYFELVLVNAAHMRQVPGRKTDVQDADWLADLRAFWVAHAQLCARSAKARSARLDAVAGSSGAGPRPTDQSHPQSAPTGGHQTLWGAESMWWESQGERSYKPCVWESGIQSSWRLWCIKVWPTNMPNWWRR
jgi:transposase